MRALDWAEPASEAIDACGEPREPFGEPTGDEPGALLLLGVALPVGIASGRIVGDVARVQLRAEDCACGGGRLDPDHAGMCWPAA